jgi:hypothetical protein
MYAAHIHTVLYVTSHLPPASRTRRLFIRSCAQHTVQCSPHRQPSACKVPTWRVSNHSLFLFGGPVGKREPLSLVSAGSA